MDCSERGVFVRMRQNAVNFLTIKKKLACQELLWSMELSELNITYCLTTYTGRYAECKQKVNVIILENWQHCNFNSVILIYSVGSWWTSFRTEGTWENGAAYILYICSLNLASTYFEIYVLVIVYMRHWPIAYGQRAKTMQEFFIS